MLASAVPTAGCSRDLLERCLSAAASRDGKSARGSATLATQGVYLTALDAVGRVRPSRPQAVRRCASAEAEATPPAAALETTENEGEL